MVGHERILWRAVALVLGLGVWAGAARSQEVEWRRDYDAARTEALEKGRPLVLDVGSADCMWCRKLEQTTLRDPGVVRLLSAHFIPLKIDADQDAFLARTLHVQGLPTIVLATPDGKVLERMQGYVGAARFFQLLEKVMAEAGPPENKRSPDPERTLQARELMTQAREAFRQEKYLSCLERCDLLTAGFGDMPEGAEAGRLAEEVKSNPEWMRQASDNLSGRLGTLYLALADSWMKKGQPRQAAYYLERVVQASPGTPQAETAQARLGAIRVSAGR